MVSIPHARIGFYDPFNVYEGLQDTFKAKIHLTNLHWRRSPTSQLKSIPQLPVEFIEELPKGFDNSSFSAPLAWADFPTENKKDLVHDLLKIPFVRLMFLRADDTESYRATVRPLIREWLKSNVTFAHGPIEWYLIFYTDDPKSQTKLFEKLKTDFDTDATVTHCIHLRSKYNAPSEEQEVWSLMNSKLKQSVLSSFSSRLRILAEGIEQVSSELKSNIPLYVVLQEGIAAELLTLHLFEDSLAEYDQLLSTLSTFEADAELFPLAKWTIDNTQTPKAFFDSVTISLDSYSLFDIRIFIFARTFKIFESLAKAAPSPSIASIHVSELLRRLQLFLQEVTLYFSQDSADTLKASEWSYMVLDEVLELEICRNVKNIEADDENLILQIFERFGEIVLLQRSKLLDLGQTKDYHVNGVLTDIRISTGSTSHELCYKPLKSTLASEQSFQDQFILLTETAIKYFSKSSRPRTIDALSIDIALLDYENKQYEKAAVVLSTCPEFYGTQGWDLIGYNLLEAYIDCLEHMKPDADFFVNSESKQTKTELLCQSYIGVLPSLNARGNVLPPRLIKKALDFLLSTAAESLKEQTAPLENVVSATPLAFVSSKGHDVYEVGVEMNSKVPYPVELTNLRLVLENEIGETIEFEEALCQLAPGKSAVKLTTTSIQFGTFTFATIAARLGPISMIHMFDGNMKKVVEVFPMGDNLTLSIGGSTYVDLDVKPFSLFINTPDDIHDASIKIWRQLEKFVILKSVVVKSEDGHIVEPVTVTDDSIIVPHLAGPQKYEVIVPFKTPQNPKEATIDIHASLTYTLSGSARQQTTYKLYDPSLSIAVSVQDIFKSDGLYSRFTIGVAETERPVRILSVDLSPSENFEVGTPLTPPPLVAFGDQPGNYFFKIMEKQGSTPQPEEYLQLRITYREIEKEIMDMWCTHIRQDLAEDGLEDWTGLLVYVSETLSFDHEEYVMNNKISVLQKEKVNASLLKNLPESVRERVESVFSKKVETGVDVDPSSVSWVDKTLKISVLIPTMEVIHTLELVKDPSVAYIGLGEELDVTLDMSSLVSSRSEKKPEPSGGKKRVLFDGDQTTLNSYSVELLTNQDSWLINGKTRFTFEIDKGAKGTHQHPTIPLSLIPLRVGKLSLPKIKVNNLNLNSKNEYLMDVDYRNESETINVITGPL